MNPGQGALAAGLRCASPSSKRWLLQSPVWKRAKRSVAPPPWPTRTVVHWQRSEEPMMSRSYF